MEKQINNPQELEKKVKELIKPNKLDSKLIKEVESLCGELQTCGELRRMDGVNVEKDNDILF
jgi:hypothetical protein